MNVYKLSSLTGRQWFRKSFSAKGNKHLTYYLNFDDQFPYGCVTLYCLWALMSYSRVYLKLIMTQK